MLQDSKVGLICKCRIIKDSKIVSMIRKYHNHKPAFLAHDRHLEVDAARAATMYQLSKGGGGGEGESAFRGDTQFCVEKFDLSENEKDTA